MERHKIIDDVSKIKNKIFFISFISHGDKAKEFDEAIFLWAAIKFETKTKSFKENSYYSIHSILQMVKYN